MYSLKMKKVIELKYQRAFTDNEEGKLVAEAIVQDRTSNGISLP